MSTYTASTRTLTAKPRSKRMQQGAIATAQVVQSGGSVHGNYLPATNNGDGYDVADKVVFLQKIRIGQPDTVVDGEVTAVNGIDIEVDTTTGAIHVKGGLYADGFVSALGSGSGSGTGEGGGGIDISDLLNVLNGTTDISEYTESKTIATAFLGNALTELTKSMVESVLTGNINSHVHNQYQTVLTGLVTSHTHATLALAHTNEINFTNTPTAGNLHNFWFNYRDGDTDAMSPNNLLTDYFFGNRNGVANARLNAGSMLLSGDAEIGGNVFPTNAFSQNVGSYSKSWNRIITRYIDTASTYDLRVCTYGTERLHINASDGHVGIGTTSPTGMLHILQSAWSDGLVLQRSAANAGCGIRVLNSVGSQLGIFGINGSQQFELTIGSTTVCLWSASSLSVTGNILATGAVTALATSASDRRLKTNIKEFYALSIINKLQPKAFKWNDAAKKLDSAFNTDDTQYGLIAQEVADVMPSLVFKFQHNEYMGVRYEKLIPILLRAIKEQQKEIDNLKKEIIGIKK